MHLSYRFQLIQCLKDSEEASEIMDLVTPDWLPDFFLVLLECDPNVLKNFRCEEVNPAVYAGADERFRFLDVMRDFVRRSVLNNATVVQGLLPRGLFKTKLKIKLRIFSLHNHFLKFSFSLYVNIL